MSAGPHQDPDEQQPTGPTVRDRRRIDPETGEVRPTQETASGGSAATGQDAGQPAAAPTGDSDQLTSADIEIAELKASLADRTADLQRVQAEYVNYKRRIDRDRDVARTSGVEAVLRDLLNVLDNIRSAREHEELSAGFRAVSDEIERASLKHGLEPFGEPGDAFDPHVHEALMHSHATDVNGEPITGPTCVTILQPGYKIREKVIRPARVAVAEPSGEVPVSEGAESRSSEQTEQ